MQRTDPRLSQSSLDEVTAMVLFAAVVDAGSFTAAAEALGLAKSVVSARVARLEKRLGVTLLHRTTRRVALTPAGAALYPSCAEVARSAAEVRARAFGDSAVPRGRLRVNAPVSFGRRWLSAPLATFVERFPEVHVELGLREEYVDPTQWDAVIRLGTVTDLELVARRFAVSPFLVAASPEYLQKNGVPRQPLDLVGHACLRYANVQRDREWCFAEGDTLVPVPVSGPVTTTDSGTLVALAESGVGLIAVPWFLAADAVRAGRLVRVVEDYQLGPASGLGCYVVHAHGPRPPARVRAFIDHLVDAFRDAPWGPMTSG